MQLNSMRSGVVSSIVLSQWVGVVVRISARTVSEHAYLILLTIKFFPVQPSDALITGKIEGVPCVLLARYLLKILYISLKEFMVYCRIIIACTVKYT